MNRYIDADAFVADSKWCGLETAEQVLFAIAHQPSIDIVRCKKCKHYYNEDPEQIPTASIMCGHMHPDDFCSYGQKGDENVETD